MTDASGSRRWLDSAWESPAASGERYVGRRASYIRHALVILGLVGAASAFLPWYQSHQWRVADHLANGVQAGLLDFAAVRSTLGIGYVPWGPAVLVLSLAVVVMAVWLPLRGRSYGLVASLLGALTAAMTIVAIVVMARAWSHEYNNGGTAVACELQQRCPLGSAVPGSAYLVGVYLALAAGLAILAAGGMHLAMAWRRRGREMSMPPPVRFTWEAVWFTSRRRIGLVLASACALSAIIVAGNYLDSEGAGAIDFAPFQAGATSCCSASEVGASWSVPRLFPSHAGREAQWVGAQTGISFFIQIGTIEEVRAKGRTPTYEPFWSDLAAGFIPQALPHTIGPGDHVRATIHKAKSAWVAVLVDTTRGWSARAAIVSSPGPAGLAEWLDEDVVATAATLPTSVDQVFAMPSKRPVAFQDLTLDGVRPTKSQLQGQGFVDATGERFFPRTTVGGDVIVVGSPAQRTRPTTS